LHNKPLGCGASEVYASGFACKEEEEEEEEEQEEEEEEEEEEIGSKNIIRR